LLHRLEKQACSAVAVLASALAARIRPLQPGRPHQRASSRFRDQDAADNGARKLPANTAEIMTRQIRPEDAPGIAADLIVDAAAAMPVQSASESGARASAAPGPPAAAPVPPPDYAAIHTIIAGIMVAMFISALEQTIVAPALPAIGRSFANVDDLSWVVTSYLLAATVATPLFGKLTDIHGRRTIMLLAIGIFTLGSLVCAIAPGIWILVVGRALQGLGGGGLIPIAQTIIADLLSPRERPMAQSYTSVVFLSASVLGPVLGGLLTDHLHWSFIFWINLPLGVIALVMTGRALRALPRHDRPHQLDIPGMTLMVAAAVALLLALAWGGTHYPWASWQVVALIGGSAVLWMLFALRLLTAREPFIPLAILRGRVTSAITCAAFFAIGTLVGVTIFAPLYCQMVLGVSASMSGLALIAFMAGTTVGALIMGRLIVRLRHYMRVPIIGLLVAIATFAVLAVEASALSFLSFTVCLGVLGVAIGPMYPAGTIVMQNGVKPHQLGTATGVLNFFRLLGGAIVVAAFGAIVLGSTGGGVMTLEKLQAAHADFVPAFRMVFAAAGLFLVIALAGVLAVEERPLHGPTHLPDPALD
jgi:EmrB/QacA subfamily drug resistance transporter